MRQIIGRGYGALVPPAAGGRRSILTEPTGCGPVQYPGVPIASQSRGGRAAVACNIRGRSGPGNMHGTQM